MFVCSLLWLALVTDSRLLDQLYERAQRALATGDLNTAIASLERITTIRPDIPEVENLWGVVYSRKHDAAAAELHFRTALQIRPGYTEARENLALFLVRQGRLLDAIPEYSALLDQTSSSADFRNALGRLYLETGNPAAAEGVLEIIPAARRDEQSWNLLGAACARTGHLAEAETAFRRALAQNPRQHDACYNLGLLLAKRGANDQAIAALQRGLVLFPGSVNLLTVLGIIYQRKGEIDLAQSTFRRLAVAHPENGQGFLFLGSSYMESGDHKRALAALLEADTLIARNGRLQYLLGLVYSYMGNMEESDARLRRSISLDPDFCFAHYQLAKSELDRGNLQSALNESGAAAVCDTEFAQPHYQMSQIHARMGRTRESEAELARFRELRARAPDRQYQVFVLP